ncbi:hypothetical protein [Xanthomonas fragariae]|nr:hypothetical protein [Xanthomonas fragariae]
MPRTALVFRWHPRLLGADKAAFWLQSHLGFGRIAGAVLTVRE